LEQAIPAEQKIKEIEEGISHYETTIMTEPDEIIKRIILLTETSNQLSICMTSGGLQFSYKYFFETKKKLLDKQKRGGYQGIRYLSYIDNDNIQIVKTFLDAGFQVRHVKNLPPLSFGISDKEAALTIEKMEGGKNIQTSSVSDDP
jgi:two-component system, OmpR family, sensor histidine kinase VicK